MSNSRDAEDCELLAAKLISSDAEARKDEYAQLQKVRSFKMIE